MMGLFASLVFCTNGLRLHGAFYVLEMEGIKCIFLQIFVRLSEVDDS